MTELHIKTASTITIFYGNKEFTENLSEFDRETLELILKSIRRENESL